jgi:hypothetical protein
MGEIRIYNYYQYGDINLVNVYDLGFNLIKSENPYPLIGYGQSITLDIEAGREYCVYVSDDTSEFAFVSSVFILAPNQTITVSYDGFGLAVEYW